MIVMNDFSQFQLPRHHVDTPSSESVKRLDRAQAGSFPIGTLSIRDDLIHHQNLNLTNPKIRHTVSICGMLILVRS